MTARRIVLLILILVFLVLPQKSFCVEKPLWEMGIGGGFLLMPDYRGSDETRAYLLPYPYAVYRGVFSDWKTSELRQGFLKPTG